MTTPDTRLNHAATVAPDPATQDAPATELTQADLGEATGGSLASALRDALNWATDKDRGM